MGVSEQWYHDVQREMASLRRQVERLHDRAPTPAVSAQVRLAKTVNKTGESYPDAADQPTNYWVTFVDGTFDLYSGAHAATLTDRQASGQPLYLAHAPTNTHEYLNEGTYIWVAWQNGRWWIIEHPYVVWRFELAQDLPQWLSHQSGQTVWRWACRRDLDPSANNGDGGYVTNNNVHFKVADLDETGWFGEIGAKGVAELKLADNGLIGIILDMVCPPECPCGDVDPDYDYYGYCNEYSGS